MPLHHSPFAAPALWCGTVLHGGRTILLHQLFFLCFICSYFFNIIALNLQKKAQNISIYYNFFLRHWKHLCVYSCLLTFRRVCLSIRRSDMSDLGSSTDWQLLTSIKLTRADMAVLLFHTVQCLWSGHVEARHNRQNRKIRIRSGKVGVGERPVSLRLTTRCLHNASLLLNLST